jgi:hypothetical protein
LKLTDNPGVRGHRNLLGKADLKQGFKINMDSARSTTKGRLRLGVLWLIVLLREPVLPARRGEENYQLIT